MKLRRNGMMSPKNFSVPRWGIKILREELEDFLAEELADGMYGAKCAHDRVVYVMRLD